MSVRIIVDSTADLIPAVKERVEVVPMTVHFGDVEYIDGVTITHQEFYKKLIESDELPNTSQATPASYLPFFEEITEVGDSAVVLTLASSLSGTYQSAMIAAADFDNIYVVDSESVAIGTGILAEYVLQLVDSGMNAQSIAEKIEVEKKNVCILALVDTLEYLQRGGRVSKTVAFAGGLLNIKPVLGVKNGEISMLGKARGARQGNSLIITEIVKAGGIDYSKPLLFGYTGLTDEFIKRFIEENSNVWSKAVNEINITLVGSVIGTHTGPGVVAVAFFNNQRREYAY